MKEVKLGARLKYLRTESHLSVEWLAVLLEVKPYTVRRYENDERVPDLAILKRYAELFFVSMDWIFNHEIKHDYKIGIEAVPPSAEDMLKEKRDFINHAWSKLERYLVQINKSADDIEDLLLTMDHDIERRDIYGEEVDDSY